MKIIKEDKKLYGYYEPENGEIGINVQLLWEDAKDNEDKFIRHFAKIMQHEKLHETVSETITNLYDDGEEEMIENMVKRRRKKGNTNYLRGYRLERDVVNNFRDKGYFSTRSAGSHSPIDVIISNTSKVKFIQLKRVKGKNKPSYKEEIEQLKKVKCPKDVSVELWIWYDGERKWKKIKVK